MAEAGTVLIYAIHRTDEWWRFVGRHLGFERSVVVSDIRGAGDVSIVDDFYAEYRRQRRSVRPGAGLLGDALVTEVIARCRLLRWLPDVQARSMVQAMAWAFDRVLERERPRVVVSFPIDRYVSDVLERLACARGIPYYELTASLVSGQAMLLYRGQLVTGPAEPDPALVAATVAQVAAPTFTPSYVAGRSRYTVARFLRIFGYFRVRGWGFRLISYLKRDPLSLHYLDAQAFLGHKPRLSDLRIVQLVDRGWREALGRFPREKRIFVGLTLFPEASIDYWVENLGLIDYENLIVEVAEAFSAAGCLVLVKDHPLQFGFRQCGLIDRLRAVPGVRIVPYDVSGNEVLAECGANFTLTGTLGLQAALAGLVSICARSYYANEQDFLLLDERAQVGSLPARVAAARPPASLAERRRRIVAHVLRGSFAGDFFSFRGFDEQGANDGAMELARNFGARLRELLASREAAPQAAERGVA